MWPMLLDMTKEESVQNLRCLELEAYAGFVTALRAQGNLSQEKLNLLKEICAVLNISQERHKAEIRRVVNDEKLTTIAYHASGQKSTNDEWLQEGRRLIPLMPRIAPQTAYSAIADEVADTASKNNKQLPLPSNTERKRQSPISSQGNSSEASNKLLFRIPDFPKTEDSKKRKFPLGVENSSLAQHLMCPPKVSRIQQIYRQKSKAKQKEFQMKLKQSEHDKQDFQLNLQQQVLCSQKIQQKHSSLSPSPINKNSKGNVQNNAISTQSEDVDNKDQLSQMPSTSDGSTIKTKNLCSGNKLSPHITFKHVANSNASTSGEVHKTIKVCTPRKPSTTKTVTTCTGQKLIVVSNAQSITTSSILQRTLTIPFVKNISVKNIDKFKIVTSNASTPMQLTSLSNSSTFTNNSKHKVVTVRANPGMKKVIPLSQLQVLNAKGSIKVLPIGGKIVTKTNGNSGSPIYIVNSNSNVQALTKSTSSAPTVVMSSMTQDQMHPKLDIKVTPENEPSEQISCNIVEPEQGCIDESCELEDMVTETTEDDVMMNNMKSDIENPSVDVPSNIEEIFQENEVNQLGYNESDDIAQIDETTYTADNDSEIQSYKVVELSELKPENFESNCEDISDKIISVAESEIIDSYQITDDTIHFNDIKDDTTETI